MGEKNKEIVRKYSEPIIVKMRETKKMIPCKFGFWLTGNSGNKYFITKEKILNELFAESGSLNNYVQSITHSMVGFEGSARKGEEVVYYTDTKENSQELNLTGIQQMLRNKADVVVTPEGVILMYQSNQIVATIDCYTEKFILVKNIDSNVKEIEKIEVDYETKKTYVDCLLNDNTPIRKEIVFSFDFTAQTAPSSVVRVYFT